MFAGGVVVDSPAQEVAAAAIKGRKRKHADSSLLEAACDVIVIEGAHDTTEVGCASIAFV